MFASPSSMRSGVVLVDHAADALHHVVRLAQVLVARALALHEVGNGVEPQAIDPLVEPEAHHLGDRALDVRIVEVEVGLMAEEAVPVVLTCATGSSAQLDVSVSVKMMRVPAYFVGSSLHT